MRVIGNYHNSPVELDFGHEQEVRSRGHQSGWRLGRPKVGGARASKTFESQAAAIVYGKGAAKRATGELFIHRPNGLIRERNSYGKDPHPPKG
jgi:Uncharacterized protein conserved in bacteria (DUF2188)